MRSIGKKLKKYWVYIVGIVLAIVCLWMLYSLGFKNGEEKIQKLWDADVAAYEATMDELQKQMVFNEQMHREETRNLTDALANAKKDHAVALATLNAEHKLRLRESSERAGIYQYQAQAGAVEQRGLASHAAKLDLAVVEGIRLVNEFAATIRLRDAQLIQLGEQIKADRKLIGDTDGISAKP